MTAIDFINSFEFKVNRERSDGKMPPFDEEAVNFAEMEPEHRLTNMDYINKIYMGNDGKDTIRIVWKENHTDASYDLFKEEFIRYFKVMSQKYRLTQLVNINIKASNLTFSFTIGKE